ncbi:MAG: carboxypeptidase regulatory-like domain-containing protein [Leptospiraceae bacterium]|nr:carboxypeptidase regulatory-like domain-containing protein [Leptospiraceae bacterium]
MYQIISKRSFLMKTQLILVLIASLFVVDCSKKKKKGLLLPFMMVLTGNNSSKASQASTQVVSDSNGVPLPQTVSTSSTTPSQEVAISGPATVIGTLAASNCKDLNNNPILCSFDTGLDLTQINIQLVDNNGNVIATTNPNPNGTYSFNIPNFTNGDYRVLINTGNGLNYTYQDFNFTFDPVNPSSNNITGIDLNANRLYLTQGPATISGTATTPGFRDQSGAVIVPAGALPTGTTVQLRDSNGNVIAKTTTNASGNYTFNIPNLVNGNYSVAVLGSGQSSNGQPFTDIVSDFAFNFSGNNAVVPTQVGMPTMVSAWNPASSAVANLNNWSIANVAVSGTDLSGFTVKLKDANGNVVASTTTNASGQYSFSTSLGSGVYSIEVSRTGFASSNSSFSFTPNPTGSATSVSQSGGPNRIVPLPSNISGRVTGPSNAPPRIEGASINFRPASNQAPSNLLYLATGSDNRLRNLASLWMREACIAFASCNSSCAAGGYSPTCIATNQGSGPWTYTTYANKVYETNGNTVLFTAVAGVWSYFASAPGYIDSAVQTITLNGQDVDTTASPIVLNPSTHRASISGQTIVLDTLVSGTRNSYGGATAGFTTQSGVPGLFAVMLGNSDSSGNPIAHITTTTGTGSYSFDGNSRVVTLPSLSTLCATQALVATVAAGQTSLSGQACNDAADSLRVAYAISQFSTATLLSASGSSIVSNSVGATVPVCFGANCPGGYQFRGGSYNIIITDPLRHMVPTSTGALINTTTVPSLFGNLNITSNVAHLPRRQITGTVTDAISTAQVSGAIVELGVDIDNDPSTITWGPVRRDPDTLSGSRLTQSDIQVASVTTNANGGYTISNVDPGTYVLRITRPGYITELIQVTVPTTGPATVANVQIVLDGPRGNIAGRVVIAGGAPFTGTYTLEVIHPTAGTRPTAPVAPASLISGTTAFTNVPNYNIFSVNPGTWRIKFASAGYVPVEGVIVVQPNATTNFDIVTMIPGSQAPASISGRLLNALTNTAITSGLTIRLRPGIGVTSGPYALDASNQTIGAVTSASDGSYVIPNVPAGNYTIEVTGTGFTTTYETVISAGANSNNQNILVSPVLGVDEVRIVLSWNATPKDVDSHLEFGDGSGTRKKQVVWNDKCRFRGGNDAGTPIVKSPAQCASNDDLTLDIDVVTGFGPETVTLKGSIWAQPRRGYSLYNWTNESPLSTSGSTVKVYKSTGLVRSYNSGPAQVGRWWQIFCLNSDRTIVDVGQTGCEASSFFNAPQN